MNGDCSFHYSDLKYLKDSNCTFQRTAVYMFICTAEFMHEKEKYPAWASCEVLLKSDLYSH